MSRYYFHSVTEDGLFKDDVGVEVDDLHLQREASRAIFELASEFVADGVLYFRVVDDVGRTVLELPLRAARSLLH
jgi:peroxiredoxin